MTTSSDSREPALGLCPQCGAEVAAEPSQYFGDVDCRHCQAPLWFLQQDGTAQVYERSWAAGRIAWLLARTARELGVASAELAANSSLLERLDSIAFVELLMELESELDSR
ncbi:phosphopantetheine-binding protein [Lignipirellula cremea]|uniref:Carrier domain-containing protein n=1 Tax=Lignipirellula cremea TaxID=2528010 RepID=A0A518DY25_9BACT|nr:phosphopantetheine-binding protein [Lignipirellula cremea]QDU96752.1 hypothetical protein Pla8534_45730 [Lignipirellula cremea]